MRGGRMDCSIGGGLLPDLSEVMNGEEKVNR